MTHKAYCLTATIVLIILELSVCRAEYAGDSREGSADLQVPNVGCQLAPLAVNLSKDLGLTEYSVPYQYRYWQVHWNLC